MLAVIAALLFLAALLDVTIGSVDLVIAGLLFVALHLSFAAYVPVFGPRNQV
jgi:hypothetical protein